MIIQIPMQVLTKVPQNTALKRNENMKKNQNNEWVRMGYSRTVVIHCPVGLTGINVLVTSTKE